MLRTRARDSLSVNWAVPVDRLPALAAPLRYDRRRVEGVEHGFVSATLFHRGRLQLGSMGLPGLSHPQLDLSFCVLDGDGVSSLFLCCVMLPSWALPSALLLARQPARGASFDYPSPGPASAGEGRRWSVERRYRLVVRAAESTPSPGREPSLGSWSQTLAFFRRRPRVYFLGASGLKRVEIAGAEAEAAPMRADVEEHGLVASCLGSDPEGDWPPAHSAWHCPELPYAFEPAEANEGPLPSRAPAPG